jgi:hypothetical protein
MNVPELARAYFKLIEDRFGPFDRPIQFQVFPFDAGGNLNFLTVGSGTREFVTYVSWDLFGHKLQQRGQLGRYELTADCNDAQWCAEVLTRIGRQSLTELFDGNDTLEIAPWVTSDARLQGVVFEEILRDELHVGRKKERCGLLRCIGVTLPELNFSRTYGVPELITRLRQAGVYPRSDVRRATIAF